MDQKCNQCSKKTQKKDPESFALQLVREYSKQAKRWFVACLIALAMLIATIAGFIWTIRNCENTVDAILAECAATESKTTKNTDMEYYEKT